MPNMTIYIRKEDLGKWLELDNKSAIIHTLLNGEEVKEVSKPKELVPSIKSTHLFLDRTNLKHCKVHGLPLDNRSRCLQKGCKYS